MAPIARAMIQEHKFQPITGDGLLIGRQTMPFRVDQAVQMIDDQGVALRPEINLASPSLVDVTIRYGKDLNYMNDIGFFSMFSDARFQALDVTDYEGAEIVHDMCEPIPETLENSVDFLWNGSCLDNMFDPATALRNTVRLLRPGGRAILMEIGTPHHNAYTIYSPAYFFDYFTINKFADCKVYVYLFPWREIMSTNLDMFVWKHFEATLGQFPLDKMPSDVGVLSYVIAENGPNSTWHKNLSRASTAPTNRLIGHPIAVSSPRPARCSRTSRRGQCANAMLPF